MSRRQPWADIPPEPGMVKVGWRAVEIHHGVRMWAKDGEVPLQLQPEFDRKAKAAVPAFNPDMSLVRNVYDIPPPGVPRRD